MVEASRQTGAGTTRAASRSWRLGWVGYAADNWAALAPELLWPLWGAALGAATLAYDYRRRGRCGHCERA
jgi:hypothetical protein